MRKTIFSDDNFSAHRDRLSQEQQGRSGTPRLRLDPSTLGEKGVREEGCKAVSQQQRRVSPRPFLISIKESERSIPLRLEKIELRFSQGPAAWGYSPRSAEPRRVQSWRKQTMYWPKSARPPSGTVPLSRANGCYLHLPLPTYWSASARSDCCRSPYKLRDLRTCDVHRLRASSSRQRQVRQGAGNPLRNRNDDLDDGGGEAACGHGLKDQIFDLHQQENGDGFLYV